MLGHIAYDSDIIKVSTVAIGLEARKINPGGGIFCAAVRITITGAPINYFVDGTVPTSTRGTKAYGDRNIYGISDITNLRMIAATATDSTVAVTYYRSSGTMPDVQRALAELDSEKQDADATLSLVAEGLDENNIWIGDAYNEPEQKPISDYIATRTTKLAVTGTIAAATNFTVTASGVNYTKSGDDGTLLATEALFNAAEHIKGFLNGVYQIKGVNATWQSATSFALDIIVNNGDEIIILS